ncbi:hypothetical protein D3C81_2203410 [compost metagenome]
MSYSVVYAAADEEQVLVAGDLLCISFDGILLSQDFFYLLRESVHSCQDFSNLCIRLSSAYFSHI